MSTSNNNWNDLIISFLDSKADMLTGRQILLKMKDEGLSSQEAGAFFETIRAKLRIEGKEEQEDRIMDVMDIIVGHCSPHLKVW